MLLKIQTAIKELARAKEIYKEKGREDLKAFMSFCLYVKITQRPFGFGYSFLNQDIGVEDVN
jgi:hypothetical protein